MLSALCLYKSVFSHLCLWYLSSLWNRWLVAGYWQFLHSFIVSLLKECWKLTDAQCVASVQENSQNALCNLMFVAIISTLLRGFPTFHSNLRITRMWANAQRDGRPAEHRWHSLFNAAKFGWRPLLDAKTRNPLKLAGVPQTNERISATRGPKITILYGHVEEVLLLNKFFSNCRYVSHLRRYSPLKLCDGAQMAIFGDFFASCICSEPRAAGFRPAF